MQWFRLEIILPSIIAFPVHYIGARYKEIQHSIIL